MAAEAAQPPDLETLVEDLKTENETGALHAEDFAPPNESEKRKKIPIVHAAEETEPPQTLPEP
ncbi:hypothetical protein, partial [Escherichia coli]|uniref:hypothetical protein n=1 Tax=Escherichia coli TaxID=562 RepID=UPI001C58B346